MLPPIITNLGVNYDCTKDKIRLEPSNGVNLSLCQCGPFGRVEKVCMEIDGGEGSHYPNNLKPVTTPFDSLRGDIMTILPITVGETMADVESETGLESNELEKTKHGQLGYR